MKSLRDLLEQRAGQHIPNRITFPPSPRMAEARKSVERRLNALSGQAAGVDPQDLHRRLCEARRSGDWSGIKGRDWRHAAVCLAMGEPPLVRDDGFMAVYMTRMAEEATRPAVRGLIRFYLGHFDPGIPGLRRIASYLAGAIGRWEWEWPARHREVALFSPDEAPKRLAAGAMASEDAGAYLARLGFEGNLATARLAGRAFLEAVGVLKASLSSPRPALANVERILAWSANANGFVYGGTPGARGRLAEALLLPWADRDPPEDIRAATERFLLLHYEDPRTSQKHWADVDEEAKRVLRRWLTKAALEQFLDVVDAIAKQHMWAARRRFWSAYYEADAMREAWVAFATEGAAKARELSRDRDNAGLANFATLKKTSGDNLQPNHAVLVMRIGDMTVADWSHDGKCHIWVHGNAAAPKLYAGSYSKPELTRGSDFNIVHNVHNTWQGQVHDFIRRHTGIALRSDAYLPKSSGFGGTRR